MKLAYQPDLQHPYHIQWVKKCTLGKKENCYFLHPCTITVGAHKMLNKQPRRMCKSAIHKFSHVKVDNYYANITMTFFYKFNLHYVNFWQASYHNQGLDYTSQQLFSEVKVSNFPQFLLHLPWTLRWISPTTQVPGPIVTLVQTLLQLCLSVRSQTSYFPSLRSCPRFSNSVG